MLGHKACSKLIASWQKSQFKNDDAVGAKRSNEWLSLGHKQNPMHTLDPNTQF